MAEELPPLPEGFVFHQPEPEQPAPEAHAPSSDLPPMPEGYVLEQPKAEAQPTHEAKPKTQMEADVAKVNPLLGSALSASYGLTSAVPFSADIEAGIHSVPGLFRGTFIEDFKRAKRAQEAAREALSKEYGKSYIGGELAGLGAVTALTSGMGLPAAEASVGLKAAPYVGELGGKALASGLGGGGLGALYGAGEGETLSERAHNAAKGAGLGFIGGSAVPVIGAAGKKAYEGIKGAGREIADLFGIGTEQRGIKSAEEAFKAMQERAGKLPPRMTPEEIEFAEKHGQTVYPMDVLGRPGIQEAKRAGQVSDIAREAIHGPLGERTKGQMGSLTKFVSEDILGMKPGEDFLSDANKRAIREQAAEYVPEEYTKVFKANPDVYHPELERVLQYSPIEESINDAVKSYNNSQVSKGLPKIQNPFMKLDPKDKASDTIVGYTLRDAAGNIYDPHNIPKGVDTSGMQQVRNKVPLELWDKLKKIVNDKAEDFRNTDRSKYREYTIASQDLKNTLKDENVSRGYEKVLEGAGKYLGEENAWNAGAKFNSLTDRQKINLAKNAISKMNPEERGFASQAYLQNRITELQKLVGTRDVGAKLNDLGREKDIAILGPEKAGLLHKWLETANKLHLNKTALGGSDTAANQYGLQKLNEILGHGSVTGGVLGAGSGVAYDVLSGKPIHPQELLKDAIFGAIGGAALKKIGASRSASQEAFANKMAEMLMSGDAKQMAEAMQAAQSNPAIANAISRFNLMAQTMIGQQAGRERHASGGKVGKRDYPAKRLTRMEKALKRAQTALAEETKPIMQMPDHHVAQVLEQAKEG